MRYPKINKKKVKEQGNEETEENRILLYQLKVHVDVHYHTLSHVTNYVHKITLPLYLIESYFLSYRAYIGNIIPISLYLISFTCSVTYFEF